MVKNGRINNIVAYSTPSYNVLFQMYAWVGNCMNLSTLSDLGKHLNSLGTACTSIVGFLP